MIHFEIHPLEGIGPIKLGMWRHEVHKVFDAPFHSFKKRDNDLVDAFFNNTFQIFYDASGQYVDYIELSSNPEVAAIYKGKNVFTLYADELISLITHETSFDPDNPELGYSFIFPELELACWRPIIPESSNDEEGKYFSTVGIGSKGYFSSPKNPTNLPLQAVEQAPVEEPVSLDEINAIVHKVRRQRSQF